MLLTVGTTEAVEAIAEAQENLQEVAKNPGILRTYFQNLVPDLLNFALQVVRIRIKYSAYFTTADRNCITPTSAFLRSIVFLTILTIRPISLAPTAYTMTAMTTCSARFLWCGGWSCTAGKSLQLCRRSADPFAKTFCGRRLYH